MNVNTEKRAGPARYRFRFAAVRKDTGKLVSDIVLTETGYEAAVRRVLANPPPGTVIQMRGVEPADGVYYGKMA